MKKSETHKNGRNKSTNVECSRRIKKIAQATKNKSIDFMS